MDLSITEFPFKFDCPIFQDYDDDTTGIRLPDWVSFQALMRKVQTLLHQLSLLGT